MGPNLYILEIEKILQKNSRRAWQEVNNSAAEKGGGDNQAIGDISTSTWSFLTWSCSCKVSFRENGLQLIEAFKRPVCVCVCV